MAMIYIDDTTFETVKKLASFNRRTQAEEVRIAIENRANSVFSSPNPSIKLAEVISSGSDTHATDPEIDPGIKAAIDEVSHGS